MATILVYDLDTNEVLTYENMGENDPMPFNEGGTLKVREFRGVSRSNLLWTTKQAMQDWNTTRARFGGAIYVGYAFRRIWEGGHSTRSQHYAGLAFDVGQGQGENTRLGIYTAAINSAVWGYVEPINLTPTWVHFDARYDVISGYRTIRQGDKGVYVMILQDALSTLGFVMGNHITGVFDAATRTALIAYQCMNGLSVDGVCGANTWAAITPTVHAIGRTNTTLD